MYYSVYMHRAAHRLPPVARPFCGNAADWHWTDAAAQRKIANRSARATFVTGTYEGRCR